MSRNEDNFYDLSQTLIERRKRLHELATEINQWEDESQVAAQPKAVQLTPKQFKWSNKENHSNTAPNNRTQTQSVQSIKSKFENQNDSTCENLTPKSIIEKFEQMSRGNSSPQSQPKFKTSSTSLNKPEARSTAPSLNESSFINTDNIKPKSIIEKFECLSKGSASLKSSNSASASLTYVSSLQSAEDEDTDFKAKYMDEQIYEDTSLFDETSDDSPETYSVSASDYTGSLMNQDEFEDDYEDEDEYDSLDDQSQTIHRSPQKASYSADVSSPPGTDTASSIGSDLQPFSIREYRKQKKSARRSSIMPKQKKTKSPLKQADPLKKSKYSERIKELEELIKHEDNIIHQTGIALERCVSDLTATNEHIECNRILLISCQKRQAYLFEVNRLKQALSSDKAGQCESSDLTGLLIFSDLQLPIKESYLNKLKAGDDKRIFYFLCLIRNGIQVLQTQVINVQELISTKDTCLIFPNRMAINNVDINFRVKIDIYTLEVMPNLTHKVKHTSSNAKFFSPFKFHHHHQQQQQQSVSSSGYSAEQTALSGQRAKTSNFIHVDTVEIGQADICRSKFKLSISSSAIPLSGLLFVNVRCMPSKSIELKGFMSVFEESKCGFATWERRWCFLNNYNISYWKYPEDEYRNGPLGVINLTKCVNDKVYVLPRDVCARKYSFELLTDEEQHVKMFRLSADSRDQANDWITNVNFALANLRLWNPTK